MTTGDDLRAHIIKSVFERRHQDFRKWEEPKILNGIGPSHPTVFDEFNANVRAALETSREALNRLSLSELEEKYDHSGWPNSNDSRFTEQVLKGLDDRIRRMEPVWFAGGFSVSGREADFKHWTKMKRWSLLETVALSIGFEPCGDIFDGIDGRGCQKDVVQFYLKRTALIKDNFNWAAPQWEGKQEVEALCNWMRDIELDVPEGLLLEAGQRLGWRSKQKKNRTTESKAFDPRERKTMLRLIIGLAVAGYRYDPRTTRSSIPKEIRNDLDQLGVNLDLNTIRKYLREGSDFLPSDFYSTEAPETKNE
ncbi:hypothetical protein [Falsiphaeobacter marinintestinus]|uniref:hypothetical protein n=1 Tax=Falsiphaeobacter marinintestinus TaxID=1492905 RepID=UPI0011B7CC14|nr:hypothetical protein [Phaeobacter marinintestinus]